MDDPKGSASVDASSSIKFGCFELDPGGAGNDSICGSGEGGAGHRPGREAARDIKLSVCWCWLSRTRERRRLCNGPTLSLLSSSIGL